MTVCRKASAKAIRHKDWSLQKWQAYFALAQAGETPAAFLKCFILLY